METSNKCPLVKATIIAFIVAVVALIFIILPAEYNLDPTGVGNKLGLTVFNEDFDKDEIKLANATSTDGSKSVLITVQSGKGLEYKLQVNQYEKIKYEWFTDGPELYFDLHGEPEGDTTGYFESYAILNSNEMKGQFTAPFNGSHGWYWKNNSDQDVKIQLIFDGSFVIEGIK